MPALLVRHCESSGPELDAPLTGRGRIQATRLARFLAGYAIDALVASPFLRARQSIAPFADAGGLAVALDARLSERRVAPGPVDTRRPSGLGVALQSGRVSPPRRAPSAVRTRVASR